MSSITVRPFRRSDRDQLTHLLNGHAQAVVPGVSITVNAVLGQLEHEPGEFLVDTWVRERATVVGEQRGRITAAAHLVRYGDDESVTAELRGAGDLRWLLQWPDASFWPDGGDAGRAVGAAAMSVMRAWNVTRCVADVALPAPGLTGVAEQWPHIVELLEGLGFASTRREKILLADVTDLPARGRDDLRVERSVGECGTRFTALHDGRRAGFVEVDTSIAGPGRWAAPSGWADIGNLHVEEGYRRRGVGTTLVAVAARWLRLARADRVLAYADPAESDLLALLRSTGFETVTTSRRGWVRTAGGM